MSDSYNNVSPIEKIISIFSYLTFGIVGMVWIIIAYILKKKLRYFLMYNIVQSMVISIFYAILTLSIDMLFRIFSFIPFLNVIAMKLNLWLSTPLIRIFNMSFPIIPLIVTLLIIYIISGVIIGRIFYVPVLSSLINKAMKSYQ